MFLILNVIILCYFFTTDYTDFLVIQSEAKDLGNTKQWKQVNVHEILHYTSFRSG